MGDCIRQLSPVPGKNTVVVEAGASRFEIARQAAAGLGLAPGVELTPELLEALEAAAARRGLAAKLLNWLRPRPRTEFEVRRYLGQRGVPAAVVEGFVDDLRGQGLVDDARFARGFVEARLARKPSAFLVLVRDLRARGVPREVAEEAARQARGTEVELELARRAARRRLGSLRGLPAPRARARLARFLAGRGFNEDTVRSVCEDLLADAGDPLSGDA